MKVQEFDYPLPEDLIAQYPVEPRDASRMMVLYRNEKRIKHRIFREIVDILDDSYVLILNNTKVIPARLLGQKETGAKIEVFLSKRLENDVWECLARPAKRLKVGTRIDFGQGLFGVVEEVKEEGKRIIRFFPEGLLSERLPKIGQVPLPPYIRRSPTHRDLFRYQTVFAEKNGSIAAPTAGLHFTKEVLEALKSKGVEIVYVTLHVGLGTFRPVKVENVEDHRMDEEYFEISKEAADKINRAKEKGKKILACGTTVVRTLETASDERGLVKATSGWTNLFIYPGYKFKVIDALLTNFHLPRSTLLMLVCAFAGKDFVMEAYNEAIKERYRFYSYGDCMLIL
ncbi:S-adenosylmethionine:tRNA ribosyltransferase-isomerase [Thermosulfidibacter takaii ABI70S6]|uniref:S-adenosylmethionine:tRNA ribosyltransferase-isomerase n=1 Tax=Thermosulfidibacter takaii (strain DSM 17441 / JCM 13301 / NBRC 103674 / ABI70S6) TaxID=1298851 RepID=A0A0S3QUD0_THET7|nr:tRNA preQ1(34) S-adenosylmethionine ribosyltransferase-isomerase QueA [Thermosulfidibacter takaii]BAT71927.1 S-adenosylmethionine:tRNA ribosyltransferase-isomerase [Thermosulfidibacter takaii ABI70S6]